MESSSSTPDPHQNVRDLTTVRFELPSDVPAQRVAVVGDFNDWSDDATVMERQADGVFAAEVVLERGRAYRYKFLLDGQRWENDPKAHRFEANDFGGDDSVVEAT
jgi:1,4-alpha-glucan branching enzyme